MFGIIHLFINLNEKYLLESRPCLVNNISSNSNRMGRNIIFLCALNPLSLVYFAILADIQLLQMESLGLKGLNTLDILPLFQFYEYTLIILRFLGEVGFII